MQKQNQKSAASRSNAYSNTYGNSLDGHIMSDTVDVYSNKIEPIANDWQDMSIVPTLENNIDIVIREPGIYPTSEIVKLNPQNYTFFNRLPAYS